MDELISFPGVAFPFSFRCLYLEEMLDGIGWEVSHANAIAKELLKKDPVLSCWFPGFSLQETGYVDGPEALHCFSGPLRFVLSQLQLSLHEA